MRSCGAISGTDNLCTNFSFSATKPKKSPPAIRFNTHQPKTNPDSSSTFSSEKNPGRRRCCNLRARAAYRPESIAMEEKTSFYDVLGIPESGSCAEIKCAYKQMALKYHPDVSPPDRMEENTQRFIQVQQAYETLSDPKMREMYDRDLARGLHLSFSARTRFDEGLEERREWKSRWQNQLQELWMKGMRKNSNENMSWGSRMRRQRNAAAVGAEN